MTACGGNLIDGEISRNEQSPLCGVATIEAAAKHRYVDRNEAQPGRKRRPKIQWFRREIVLGSVHTTRKELILSRFFVRQGAFPQEYWRYFKEMQRSMTENQPEFNL